MAGNLQSQHPKRFEGYFLPRQKEVTLMEKELLFEGKENASLIGALFNVLRILAFGIVIGYLYKRLPFRALMTRKF